MLHRIDQRQVLATSPSSAWRFLSDPANLKAITPPWLDLTITSTLPDGIHPGLIITYTHRPLPGLVRPWVTEITHVDAPVYFVDEQRLGPFRFWHHSHRLLPAPEGVEMVDCIHYALPLGPVGALLHALTVRRRLETIFRYRAEALKAIFP